MDSVETTSENGIDSEHTRDSDDDVDSLFDEAECDDGRDAAMDRILTMQDGSVSMGIASRIAPAIPGLYFDPFILIPQDLADCLWTEATRRYFTKPNVNQIMLFERASEHESSADCSNIRLPPFLLELLDTLSNLLRPIVPEETHDLLFRPSANRRARQAILNLYKPGEGISPHVDLLKRFGDGIIGVSLQGGCVMEFKRVGGGSTVFDRCGGGPGDQTGISGADTQDLYLPARSVIIMTGEARYKWMHGIEKRTIDYVRRDGASGEFERLHRGKRLSITFRWLLPGAEVVGGDD